uniref:3-hydroxyacyl-CoA dehydrogenase n=1 Tax=Aureoumbra lagunensis TaxID=44058 RepID=A0A7S3JSZ2_9STRA|mmetsp:Transcript_19591/g.29759  ORF Transcript_19591/g.29759 Transcript_19591/m.29759 type:complete len:322 (-) Transcript_19591:1195-2160(-)
MLKQSLGRSASTAVSEIRRVGVVGLGLLGHGIAQEAAAAKFDVIGVDTQDSMLKSAEKNIHSSISKLNARKVKKGTMTEVEAAQSLDETMSRLSFAASTSNLSDCDLVIEAIVENIDIKCKFFKELHTVVKPSAIFASNTSSLKITTMATASTRESQFVGLHYFNPVQLMKLVEVIRTDKTSSSVVDAARSFAQKCGKRTVDCIDTPGFVVNRLLVPYIASAVAMAERRDASISDIDTAMQLGAGNPMGPILLCDYVGLDTTLNILRGWKQEFPHEPAFFVPNALEAKVKAGKLGRKSGEGFYFWDDGVNSTKPTGVSGLE